MLNKILLSPLLLVFFCLDARAEHGFFEANQSFDSGNYTQAVSQYEALLEDPNLRSAEVFYNLGNAHYRLGDRGKAIASYLAARRLSPRNPDIKANLNFLMEQNQDRLSYQKQESWLDFVAFWHASISQRELLGLFALLCCLAGISASTIKIWPKYSDTIKPLASTFSSLSVFFLVAFALSSQIDRTWGAVGEPSAKVRSGPGEGNTIVFELHQGAPFSKAMAKGEWLLIELSDGKKGWIKHKEVYLYDT